VSGFCALPVEGRPCRLALGAALIVMPNLDYQRGGLSENESESG